MRERSITLNISVKQLSCYLRWLKTEGQEVEHHPLGFYRLPLTEKDRLKDGFYLHLWPTLQVGKQDTRSEVHCHIFDLKSRILGGSLTDCQFDVTFDKSGTYVVCEVLYDGQQSRRWPTKRRAICRSLHDARWNAGEVYSIPNGTFHHTLINEWPTATLMHKTNVNALGIPINLSLGFPNSSDFNHSNIPQEFAWNTIMNDIQNWVESLDER